VLEAEVIEFLLRAPHAEAVGNRHVDLQRFRGDPDLLLAFEVAKGAHVVQPVGQLDEDHSYVVHHRHQQLAEILGLLLLQAGEGDLADLGDPFDKARDLGAEGLFDLLSSGERVLEHVVQQTDGYGYGIEVHLGEDVGDFERVRQIRLAAAAKLILMLLGAEDVCAAHEIYVGLRVVPLQLLYDILNAYQCHFLAARGLEIGLEAG